MLVWAASANDPSVYLQQVVNGITVGAVYALVALGYTLVYGIIELINFAHADVFTWGGVITSIVLGALGFTNVSESLTGFALIGMLAFLIGIAMIFCGVLNFAIERIAYRPLRRAPRLAPLIAAIAVSFILETTIQLKFSAGFIQYPTLFPAGGFQIGSISFPYLYLFIIALAVVLMLALERLIRTTKIGRAMRAVAQDPEAAALMAVNINRTISFTFIVGGALAGAGSVVFGLYSSAFKFNTGFELGLIAFTAAVLGGIGNIYGAVLGGLLIGLVQTFTIQFFGAQWSDSVAFAVLVLIFVFRPSGLLGQQVPDKV